jgi:ubiquinone/menaquinone biosynthesis C-methylase UbiE
MNDKIIERYTEESSATCNLSCGNNLDILQIKPRESILDLGCGRGEETIKAAKLTGSDGFAVGLDITPSMIHVAKDNAKTMGIENAKFVTGDIENLPFEDEFFDATISNCVINHAKSKETVFSEIFRVLKYGGRFVISDAVTKIALPQKIKDDPEAIAQCFGGALTESEYIDIISSAGFSNIKIVKRREYVKNGYDFISITVIAIKQKNED